MSSLQINEVAPRDGLQIEAVFVPTNEKIHLIDGLSAIGLVNTGGDLNALTGDIGLLAQTGGSRYSGAGRQGRQGRSPLPNAGALTAASSRRAFIRV